MSIGIADQRLSYDNPCAPIVKFAQSDNLDDDDDDVMDERVTSSTDLLLQPNLEHSIKALSLEDLVQSFDQTIHACFPTTPIIELDDNATAADSIPTTNTWSDLVEHLRASLRQDLKLPHIAQNCRTALQTTDERTICPDDIQSIDDLNEDEEEELREQLDMHSVIVSSHTFLHEPFLTAEQVISEIDFMLQDMTPDSGFCDDLPELHSPHSFPPQHQSIAALNQLYDELNASIKDLSGVLVQELALRDDLEDEKESRNTFISLVVSIQNKRRHLINDKRHKRRSLFGTGSSPEAGTFLTTVIPVDGGRAGCLSSEHLQNLNPILHAINEDSPQVPELLTNYILKVLCPC